MASPVAVVVDSGCGVPPALAQRWGMDVVPLYVNGPDSSRREGVDIDTDVVLAEMVAGARLATSQPTPQDFDAAYARAADGGAGHVVSVHLSAELSGTVEVARAAAARASVPVTVLDSRSVAMGAGWGAYAAARVAAAGGDAELVAAAARDTFASSHVAFTVSSLEYLRRSGRASGPLAAIGEALGIRPVLGVVDGQIELMARARTRSRALQAVEAFAEERLAGMSRPVLAISGLGDQDIADDIATALERRHGFDTVVRTPIGAALAVHCGPGTFVAAVADLPDGTP